MSKNLLFFTGRQDRGKPVSFELSAHVHSVYRAHCTHTHIEVYNAILGRYDTVPHPAGYLMFILFPKDQNTVLSQHPLTT